MTSIRFKLHAILLSSLCCGIITVFLGCGSNQNPAGVAEPDNSTGELHPGGLISLHEDIPGVTKLPLSKSAPVLPASIDLTSKFSTPGDQGSLGSCIAFATLAAKGYEEGLDWKWAIQTPSTISVLRIFIIKSMPITMPMAAAQITRTLSIFLKHKVFVPMQTCRIQGLIMLIRRSRANLQKLTRNSIKSYQ